MVAKGGANLALPSMKNVWLQQSDFDWGGLAGMRF